MWWGWLRDWKDVMGFFKSGSSNVRKSDLPPEVFPFWHSLCIFRLSLQIVVLTGSRAGAGDLVVQGIKHNKNKEIRARAIKIKSDKTKEHKLH
jgi:hypothetical protein